VRDDVGEVKERLMLGAPFLLYLPPPMPFPVLLLLVGLLLAIEVIAQARSGRIGGRLGKWTASKEQMPVLFYGSLVTEGVMALSLIAFGTIYWVMDFPD
jgi:hypothetical protein